PDRPRRASGRGLDALRLRRGRARAAHRRLRPARADVRRARRAAPRRSAELRSVASCRRGDLRPGPAQRAAVHRAGRALARAPFRRRRGEDRRIGGGEALRTRDGRRACTERSTNPTPDSMIPLELHPDRLFPAEPATRALARSLYQRVADLPIVSPHGHTDPRWFAENAPFADPATLLIVPDHYVFRMLYSQGVALEALGVPRVG